MTVSNFAFTPSDGLRNAATYPTTPANEAAARDQMQDPSDQLRDFINGTLIPAVNGFDLSSAVPITQKGAINGVATLDGSGTIPDAQIPAAITRDTELSAHTSRTDNPHSVTAAQIGAADLTSFVNSKAANGYQKLAGGLIIQWGVATLSGNTLSTVTLPIAFPTAFVSVTANAQNAPIFVSSLTTTNFQVFPSSANSQTVYWIAIGY